MEPQVNPVADDTTPVVPAEEVVAPEVTEIEEVAAEAEAPAEEVVA